MDMEKNIIEKFTENVLDGQTYMPVYISDYIAEHSEELFKDAPKFNEMEYPPLDNIFELINNYKTKKTKRVFNKIVKITSKRLDYLSSLCSKYKELNVFSDILWCKWWELEDISEITDENIEFYARHIYEGDYDTIIVPIHWFTISDEEFLNEIRDREIKRIDIYINKHQKIIDDFYNKKVELENYNF